MREGKQRGYKGEAKRVQRASAVKKEEKTGKAEKRRRQPRRGPSPSQCD